MGRHRVAIVVLRGTFVLDLAVAVQAFGRRPSIFAKIREEAEPPYEVVICGTRSTPTSLGFSIGELAVVRGGRRRPTPSWSPGRSTRSTRCPTSCTRRW